ncbi:hypothetical protein C4552_01055 [Candidatus Parcubacteria bacterium]|nr:MAG: hypothetical protein C4552_01055 [Candidatus Parcubacteria bacterium]
MTSTWQLFIVIIAAFSLLGASGIETATVSASPDTQPKERVSAATEQVDRWMKEFCKSGEVDCALKEKKGMSFYPYPEDLANNPQR